MVDALKAKVASLNLTQNVTMLKENNYFVLSPAVKIQANQVDNTR